MTTENSEENYELRRQIYHTLMPFRVREILQEILSELLLFDEMYYRKYYKKQSTQY